MTDISSPIFDQVKDFVRRFRSKDYKWGNIPPRNDPETFDIDTWIEEQKLGQAWPDEIDAQKWGQILEAEKYDEMRRIHAIRQREEEETSAQLGPEEVAGRNVPPHPQSSWQLYKEHLGKEWSDQSIQDLEITTLEILNCLKDTTRGLEAVKGMVIGHVQSGKTANMAGLMAMAADWGFNMFIILSGTIDNLRKQTQDRIINDLSHEGHLHWQGMTHLSPQCDSTMRAQNLSWGPYNRYFTVTLKHESRLNRLRGWLCDHADSLDKMKILIIDDEADQAGVNSGNIEAGVRTTINNCIINLTKLNAGSVNYIGYTATPYANVLNEGPGDTLYPADFIRSLKPSNEYFGPGEIFGIDGVENSEGLSIWREVGDNDVKSITDLHGKKGDGTLPPSFIDAVAWFLCATAARRYWGQIKPSTMLVHTSHLQGHHDTVADAIGNWLRRENREAVESKCEEIWKAETQENFSRERFRKEFPTYGKLDSIKNYPGFSDIQENVKELLDTIAPVKMDGEGKVDHHKGIHLCIDNCSHNRRLTEEDHIRLLYPDKPLDHGTAFIVVGGATLSRGLTLQGLVSTYFLRTSSIGDSLMQMGRWFGYRVGYELLPRIWMTSRTKSKFRYLAGIEHSLRQELTIYEGDKKKPYEFGPRINTHPLVSFLRITSKNRMQGAVPAKFDFSGITNQTTIFSSKEEWLQGNINKTHKFFDKMGGPEVKRNCLVWKGVPFAVVSAYLSEMNFHERSRVFSKIKPFIDWYEQASNDAGYDKWNVILASKEKGIGSSLPAEECEKFFQVGDYWVKKVNRSQLKKGGDADSFSIGVLISGSDRLADIDGELKLGSNRSVSPVRLNKIRHEEGLGKVPQLLIYRIDKNSKPDIEESENRQALQAEADVIGLALLIPGSSKKGSLVRSIQVKITAGDLEVDEDDIDDSEGGRD